MKFIAGGNIPELLERLSSQAEVWAPRELRGSGGTVMFERWRSGDPLDLEHFASLSAKDMVLPRTEKLFGFSYAFGGAPVGNPFGAPAESAAGTAATAGESIRIIAAEPAGNVVLFGARACDAKALTVLDALFGQTAGKGYNDPQYRARRTGLTVITLACVTCDPACFCSSFENGTAEKAGSDLILYPVDGGFLAEAVTPKGEAASGPTLFEESGLETPVLAVTAKVEGLEGLRQKLAAIFDDLEFWQTETEKCISCGYCTYACPTCHCFNIHDEMRGDREGERLRSWDACMFHLYTQETSGHNPRPTLAHRYRNRINHKFSYYPENQGEILCTGCGRCIRGCPVGLDIRDVLQQALDCSTSPGEAGGG
ncbi:MAG: 4Fe-4S dicluster domain-containing protein [Thermoleophilia bacterium]